MKLNNFTTLIFLWMMFFLTKRVFAEDMNYLYFDDYLSSLNEDEQFNITGEQEIAEGSGSIDEESDLNQNMLPLRTGLTKSKDETCCALGQLAGDKGYHCVAQFYAARIMLRNKNRPHNRKLGFHGPYRVPDYGTKLMSTFKLCVANRVRVFNKCCHVAAMVRKAKPHYDSIQRRRYEMKMKRIRMPKHMQVDNLLIGV